MTAVTGSWAQDSESAPFDLTYNATADAWTLADMPNYDVELEVEYEPGYELTLTKGSEAFAKVYGIGTLNANQCWLQFDKQQPSALSAETSLGVSAFSL